MSEQIKPLDEELLPVIRQEDLDLDRIVRLAKALSDPIRVRMLNLMAEGRGCCGLPSVQSLPVPGSEESEGICVCEFQEWYTLGQSKVSYHLKILKDAGLIREEGRGKWTFYSLNRKVARELIGLVKEQLKI